MSDIYGSNTWRSLWEHTLPTLQMSQNEYWQRRVARHGTNSIVIDAVTPQYNAYKYDAYNDMRDARARYNERLNSREASFRDLCQSDAEENFYRTRTGRLFPEYHSRLVEPAREMARMIKRSGIPVISFYPK